MGLLISSVATSTADHKARIGQREDPIQHLLIDGVVYSAVRCPITNGFVVNDVVALNFNDTGAKMFQNFVLIKYFMGNEVEEKLAPKADELLRQGGRQPCMQLSWPPCSSVVER